MQQQGGARQPVVQIVAFADRRACNGKQIDRRLQQLPEPFGKNALPQGKTVEDRAIAGTKALLRARARPEERVVALLAVGDLGERRAWRHHRNEWRRNVARKGRLQPHGTVGEHFFGFGRVGCPTFVQTGQHRRVEHRPRRPRWIGERRPGMQQQAAFEPERGARVSHSSPLRPHRGHPGERFDVRIQWHNGRLA